MTYSLFWTLIVFAYGECLRGSGNGLKGTGGNYTVANEPEYEWWVGLVGQGTRYGMHIG